MNVQGRTGELEGKTVIVTGAAQGIGAATARYLADLGASVVVCDIQGDKAEIVAAEIRELGDSASAFSGDVTSWDDCTALVEHAVEIFGNLTGVVNNAGILHRATPFDETDNTAAKRVFEVNLLGTYSLGVVAMQYMAEHGGGSIVNVTSGVQAGLADGASYSASKGGVASLTYSWAIDCLDRGIRVNAISPVATTPMTQATYEHQVALGQHPSPREDVDPTHNCPPIAYFLSDRSAGVTGQILRTHGTTLQLIAHPVVMHPELEQETWTLADVDTAVQDVFSKNLPKLGLQAARVEYVDISKHNAVPGIDRIIQAAKGN